MHRVRATTMHSYVQFTSKLLLFANLVTILLAACAPDSAWEDDPIPPPVVESIPLTLALETQTAPDDYAVTISWPTPAAGIPYLISRENKDGVPVAFALDEKMTTSTIVDDSVVAGTTYTYSIFILSSGTPVRLGSATIEIPKDKVIRESGEVGSMQIKGRLFISSGVTLLTNAQSVSIEATEIHSEGAEIRTFDPQLKAELQQVGQTPQNVTIRAKRGTGRLTILANAQNGGDGMEGAPGQTGVPGGAGSDGLFLYNPAMQQVLTDPADYERIQSHRRQNPPPPTDSSWKSKMENGQPAWLCGTPPSNGAQGGQGTAGTDGTNGANGGDSPSVLVEIEELSSFFAQIEASPGLGGHGGRGGQGGSGGMGGLAGNLDAGHLCAPATQGPIGEPGPQGRTGRQGERGNVRPFCFSMAGETRSGDYAATKAALRL